MLSDRGGGIEQSAGGFFAEPVAFRGAAVGEEAGERREGVDFHEALAMRGGELGAEAVEFVAGGVVGRPDGVGNREPGDPRAGAAVADAVDDDGVERGVVEEVLEGQLAGDAAIEVAAVADLLDAEQGGHSAGGHDPLGQRAAVQDAGGWVVEVGDRDIERWIHFREVARSEQVAEVADGAATVKQPGRISGGEDAGEAEDGGDVGEGKPEPRGKGGVAQGVAAEAGAEERAGEGSGGGAGDVGGGEARLVEAVEEAGVGVDAEEGGAEDEGGA